jgi:DNA-binding NarL/FixJ family response regulator
MEEKILLVDDESNVLEGYRRSLSREFRLETALGPEQALAMNANHGPYAVVVSDMRMPGMNGIQLLTAIRAQFPYTVRIILTGNADMQTAIDAINEGSIFRFLNKPCPRETMAKTLTAGLLQYRLVNAEKDLLEQTLSGCIQVLTEVLSLVNPAAFSRAERVRRYIRHVVTAMKLGNVWQYEVAAMLSQLGCVTLPPETIDALYRGQPLTPAEQAQYDAHPSVAYKLLSRIPRLEAVAWMIEHQNQPVPAGNNRSSNDIRRGAEILRLVLAFEDAVHKGSSKAEAAQQLARQNPKFSREFFEALLTLDADAERCEIKQCPIDELAPGMIVQQEIRTLDRALVVAKGQAVTAAVIFKLKNLSGVATPASVKVSLPQNTSTVLAMVRKGGFYRTGFPHP